MKTTTDSPGAAAAFLHGMRRKLRGFVTQLERLLEHYGKYGRLMRLDRPIGIWLLLWPTLWALWIAGDGVPDQRVLLIFILGTIVTRSAGCIINDFADRRIDPHVKRTSGRPLATGEIAPAEALLLFVGLMFVALGLVLALNRLTLLLALFGAAVTIIYPFTKRVISAPQFVLGVAFAWAVPMAFAAQTGTVPRIAWLLFMTTIVWVVIYDTEYAMVDRDDDLELGVNSTAILFGDLDRVFLAGLQALLLLSLVLVGRTVGLGAWYFGGVGCAALLMLYQQFLMRHRDREGCFRAFLNNAWLGGVVFTGLVLDYLFRLSPAA